MSVPSTKKASLYPSLLGVNDVGMNKLNML